MTNFGLLHRRAVERILESSKEFESGGAVRLVYFLGLLVRSGGGTGEVDLLWRREGALPRQSGNTGVDVLVNTYLSRDTTGVLGAGYMPVLH